LSFIVQALNHLSERLSIEKHQSAESMRTTYTSTLKLYEYVNKLTNHTGSFLISDEQKKKNIQVHRLVQDRIDFFTPLANQKRNELINAIHPECELHSNGELLNIVIHNLIDNAIKYSH